MTIDIKLQSTSEIVVGVGDNLHLDTIVARGGTQKGESHVLPIAQTLGFSVSKIFLYMHTMVGQHVKKGEPIASYKKGLQTKQYISEYDGIITSISHLTGTVIVQSIHHTDAVIYAQVEGVVQSIMEHIVAVEITSTKTKQFILTTPSTDTVGGKIYFIEESSVALLKMTDVQDCIIIAPSLSTYALAKLRTLGSKYIYTTTMHGLSYQSIQDYTHAYSNAGDTVLYCYTL